MQVGPYKITSIDAGNFLLDGGAMFGVIPKALWEKRIPADKKNCIPMMTRCMLIEGNGRKILVDVGCGTKYSEKFKNIYQIKDSLEDSLAKHGVAPEEITDVILTHLHFDHTGGATQKVASSKVASSKGRVVPTFPNTQYYVQKTQLEWARKGHPRDTGSYFAENFEPLSESLVVLDGEKEIAPGVWIKVTNGHTPGQQHAFVTDGKTGLFYAADLIPTSAHIDLVWTMAYDLDPLLLIEEKKALLDEAVKNGWVLFFEHCPVMEAGKVAEVKGKYEIHELNAK